MQFLVALNQLLPFWNRCWWNSPWSSMCLCTGRAVSWGRGGKRLCWHSERVGSVMCCCSCPHSSRNATETSLLPSEQPSEMGLVSYWMSAPGCGWEPKASPACSRSQSSLGTSHRSLLSPAPAFPTEGAEVGCARCAQAKGESPQWIFVAPVFHQVGVDLLEMQECQKSNIWNWNFYFSSTDTIRTFQAVCWKRLLVLPHGNTGSEFHLMKWARSLCQTNPSWVMPGGMSWKSCSADFCKLEPKSTATQEPVPHSGWLWCVPACLLQMEEDDKWTLWSTQDECVPGVEENCAEIKSRYVHRRWQYSLEPYSTSNCFLCLTGLCKFV